jgi:hypothetical protein
MKYPSPVALYLRTTRTLPLPSTETFYQDSQGQLGFNEYRLRRTKAIGKHWSVVCVAYSLLHLTCLPTVPDRTKGLLQTLGDACRQQGRALLQKLLVNVHDQLSHGNPVAHVFAQLFAKQRGMERYAVLTGAVGSDIMEDEVSLGLPTVVA